MSQKIKTSVEIDGSLSASQIANATTDTDKFLVSDNGTVKYRTGAEMLSDLGVSQGTASRIQHQVKAGVAINKGQAVYVTSADGTNMIVGLASNTSESTSSKTMGLLNATVSTNGFADVITEGLLSGLDTSTAVVGNPVWLGTGGNLIYGLTNKPYAPAHLVFIGIVTRVNANNGEIFVKVQNGFELDELHDVDLKTTTPINGHLLGFNGTLWVNKTIAGWLGYTPQAQLNGNGFVKASGNTITYDNTSYYPASNPNGYISTYTETDTLASVTARGASTSTAITLNTGNNLISTATWEKLKLVTTGVTAAARQGSDGNGLNFTSNALWNSGWSQDDSTKKSMAYIQHLGNGRHEFRTSGSGGTVSWVTGLTIDEYGAQFNVPLSSNGLFSFSAVGNVSFTSNDASSYPRFTGNYSSAQIGLFRSGSDVGGMYIGGTSTGFRVFDSSFNTRLLISQNGDTSFSSNVLTVGGNQVWHVGNDGSGSGLDADLLDGQHAVSFAKQAYVNVGYDFNTLAAENSDSGIVYRLESSVINPPTGGIYNWSLWQQGNSTRGSQIAVGAYGGNEIYFRGANADTGSYRGWQRVLHDGNYSSFAVPTSRTITINGTSYDLSANRSWTVTAVETDTLATVTARGASTSTLPSFNGGLTATKTAKNAYAIQVKGGLYGAPRLQLYDLAIDSNAFVGLGVDMSGATYEFSNYFPRTGGNGKWSVGSWAGDFGTGQYVSGYNEKLWVNESSAQFNVSLKGTVDMRSPIFYDSNNTGFYGDFASTSNFNKLLLNSENSFNASTPGLTSYGLTLIGGTTDYANGVTWTWGNTNVQAGVYVQSSGAYGTKMYFATTDSFATGSKTAMHIDHYGTVSVNRSYLQSDSSLRAPIFYDSNDTGYYWNPNTSSGHRFQTPSGYIDIGPMNGSWSHFETDRPSFYFGKSVHVNGSFTIYGNSSYLDSGRIQAPIFYASDDTSYYLDPNSTSNIDRLMVGGGITDPTYTRISTPGGGSYVTTASTVNGAIRILLPTQGSAMMMTCTIKVYEYSTNKSFTITVGGHRDSANWYNEFCYMDGGENRGELTVRFGVDSGKDCIYIGETNSSWSYPQVFVTDVELGYTGYNANWTKGWSVGFVTSFASVTRTQTAYRKLTPANYSSYALPLSGGTMSGQILTPSVGTGVYDGAIQIRETGYVSNTQYDWGYAPAISFHWGNRHAKKFGMRSDGLFAVNDVPIVLADGGTWSINIAGNASTVGSATVNTLRGGVGANPVNFTVNGDANTYYPVQISPGGQYGFNRYSIYRGYSETAPWDPIGTGSHKGGLTLTFDWSSDIAWGGNDKSYRVMQFNETYTTMVAGMTNPVTGGIIVWLRGGGAAYHLQGPNGINHVVDVYYSGYTAANGSFFGVRTNLTNVAGEIMARYPIRDNGDGQIFVNNSKVLYEGSWINSKYFGTDGNIYAAKFSDSDDGSYYVEPAALSNLYNLQLTGAKNTYLFINPGTGYEAMLRVQGGSGSSWYAGKRMTSTTQAGTDGFHFYSDAGGDTVVGFGTDGTIKAKGDVVAYSSSDRQLKDNILPIENALEKVKKIGGYTFNWNDKQTIYEGHDIGVIAQEIESVLPEVVTTRDTGFKAVKYEKIVPLLIEAIKEQQTQIDELKELVNKLINK